jgi:hypothetical protein
VPGASVKSDHGNKRTGNGKSAAVVKIGPF